MRTMCTPKRFRDDPSPWCETLIIIWIVDSLWGVQTAKDLADSQAGPRARTRDELHLLLLLAFVQRSTVAPPIFSSAPSPCAHSDGSENLAIPPPWSAVTLCTRRFFSTTLLLRPCFDTGDIVFSWCLPLLRFLPCTSLERLGRHGATLHRLQRN